MIDLDTLLAQLVDLSKDPVAFVYWAFPWGQAGTDLENRFGPEQWQLDLLVSVRDGLMTPQRAIREATVSGNGVGKSAVVSWLILFLHCTREDTKGVVTANTETQLKTKTWAELGKWFNLFIAKDLFRLTATALFSRDPERDRTWRTDMVPWSEHNIVAFQGLHNEGKRLFIIMDEASGVMDGIWEAADGCMTDANTERVFAVFGNPNEPKGRFKECFPGGKFAHAWKSRRVDSRSVSFTDKAEFEDWIAAHGIDSDFVRVRILGQFPRVSVNSFISLEIAYEAARRPLPEINYERVILGVDVGRFGGDPTVVYPRQGRDARSRPMEVMRGWDLMKQASRIVQLYNLYRAALVCVDVGGVGGGLVDRLRQLGLDVWEVDFGAAPDGFTTPSHGTLYMNKRAEIWGALRDFLTHGCIQEVIPGQELTLPDELAGPLYGYSGEDMKIQLERKRDMRRRQVPSPNAADALACTFAAPEPALPLVQSDDPAVINFLGTLSRKPVVAPDYDPFSHERMHANG